MRAKKRRVFRREDIPLYFMAIPGTVFLLIFCYLPMLGLIVAFQKYSATAPLFRSPFVGLANFKFLFSTSDAWLITRNTVLYNLVFIVLNMVVSILISMMLSVLRSQRTGKALQTVYMLPYFLSWPVINIIIYAFLDRQNGLVNGLMAFLGMSDDSSWYNIISIWPPLIVMINLWKGVGYQTVLFLAVISGISRDYYEASMLDGATKLQQARYITLPHLRFVVSVLLIMAMGNIFRGDFGLFYIVTRDSGTLYPVTDVIDTYVFRGLRVLNNFGMSTAAGFYQSIVGLILVLISNKVVTKIDPESAMF